MQEAKKDLLQAEQFFNKHGPRHAVKPKSENSKNSGDPRWAENRSKQLSHSLNARRQSKDASIVDIRCQQNELPVVQIKRKVLDLIDQHTYSIIAAETGSGKSTQIPQMILDDATDQGIGGQCQVICVQPRRMAAQLLAARVSHERGEAVGDTVGCVTRFDHRKPAKAEGSITYCTTGIMLNIIQNRPEILSSLTHIMLDEVHVRDLEIDLIMLLLKRYVDQCRLNGVRVPKIVILSATIDLDLFSSYFTNIGLNGERIPAPHISIPGRQYEVKKHHLEDVLDDMATTFEPAILSRLLRGPETKAFLDKHYARFKGSKNSNTVTTNSALKNFSNLNRVPARIEVEDKLIPYGLTAALILHLLTTTTSGAILVFLPGLLPIEKLAQRILEFTAMKGFDIDFANQDRFRLLKLHAALPHEMAKLSQPFPKSCRRVFLSTDVAEASVTIPDVKYVIDSGRVNNVVYNHTGRSSRLGSFWASKSSIIQRAGRAGRVQNGEYFFLGNQKSFDELRKMKPPAIHHTSLDSVCLRMKSIAPDTPIRDVLEGAIEPPEADAVVQAIKHLIEKRALDKNENMTDLGILLNHLPIVPSAGKLIILGAIFHCLEPMLILAALEEKSLFRRPFDLSDGEVIRQKRLEFAEQSHSDNISAINAFKAIRDAERAGSDSARQYAETQHLDYRSYELARDLAKGPLLDSLKRTRIIGKSTPNDDCGHLGGKILNGNSNCIPLIKALILHAQFPQVVAPVASKKSSYFSKSEGLNLLAWMSVASIKPTPLSQDLLTYQVKISGDRPDLPPLLRGASLVSPLTMCLFGGRMVWKDGMFQMDSWLPLGVRMKDQTYTSNEAARAIVELHKAIDKTLKTVYEALVQQLYSTESYGTNEPINLKQMVRLWGLQKKLQKAVLATLEQDNHRFAVPGPGNWDEHGLELDEDEFIQEDSLVRADNSEFDGETSVQ
ncbi:hypothetical protein N7454_006607 [Penicillium verhagenii]|nr:hypothetical protein N7454_006607 [Penicillium verhagenii]